MIGERYVVVGLAHVRSSWFTEVARWATAGSLPIEFVKCLSPEELRARMGSGRAFSAALLDGGLPAVDRDLVATLHDLGTPSVVVVPATDQRDWEILGAATTLRSPFDQAALRDALEQHGRSVGAVTQPDSEAIDPGVSAAWRGRLVAVLGRPGAGTSTVAVAVAQHLADDPRYTGDVVLADLARHAHQALLHDAGDVVPSIQEVVEAHRTGRPTVEQVRRLSFDVPARRYRLVLGLRRPRDGITLRTRAFAAAIDGLRRSARIVVVDTDGDLEGEAETGSFDIEDRNLMARTSTADADVVVAVARPTTAGIHGLVGLLADLRSHGVPGERTLVVITEAPRAARSRAELTRAVANLTGAADCTDPYIGPVFIGARRQVDRLHHDVCRFPAALTVPAGRAVRDLLEQLPLRASASLEPVGIPVTPGSLGRWTDDDAVDEEATP